VDGPESLDGTPYHWLERHDLLITFEAPPEPGDVFEIGWGAKSDEREAVLVINGQTVPVRGGGHWGFRWLRVRVPEAVKGEGYQLEMRAGEGRPGFISEIRLFKAGLSFDGPDPKKSIHRASLVLRPAKASPVGEAFPQMRAFWDRAQTNTALAQNAEDIPLYLEAEKNSRLAAEGLFRCRRYIDGWLAHADPATGLIPRNLGNSGDYWNGRDAAADNYPFMVLTAALTDRPLMEGRL
jgi:hypothetical protein